MSVHLAPRDRTGVYALIPVVKKERAQAAEHRWTSMGYRVLFYQDPGTRPFGLEKHTRSWIAPYRGVWNATNDLARMAYLLGAEVCLFVGDDMDPDPNHDAEAIATQYLNRFPDGFGLMQPCGDPQGVDGTGRSAAARICGSVWFGRGWIERAYGGRGPTPGEYYHFYADEELALVGEKLGVMWWRPDLTQWHHHWSFGASKREWYHDKAQTQWDRDKRLFGERRNRAFIEADPLPAEAAT